MEAKHTAHTALPWTTKQSSFDDGVALFWIDYSKGGLHLRRLDDNGKFSAQDAAFILRACSSHDDLKQRLCNVLDERDGLVRLLEKATHALSLYNDKLPMLAELNAAIEKVRDDQ